MNRVLHIVGKMNRGGLETFLMNVYRNIDREKIQFDFLVHTTEDCDYNSEIRRLGGKIYSVIPRKEGIQKNRNSLNQFFKENSDYKIIHQHISSLSYIEPLKIARKHNIPIRIVHGHSTKEGGSYFHKYIHRLNQIGVKSYATGYFACSDLAAKWLYGKRQYSLGNFNIINNGVDIMQFAYNTSIRKEERKKFNISDKFVIGNVGRFVDSKNHNFLIDIFKSVYSKNPNTVLLLVGDGERRKEIEEKVNRLGLKDNVIFTGVRSDIYNLLQVMDVFVMPSYYEGLPVTLVEAQASGLYCIVSDSITRDVDVTDLMEYINLDKSPDYWANRVILRFPNQRRENTAAKLVESGFDIKEVANSLQRYYLEKLKEENNGKFEGL